MTRNDIAAALMRNGVGSQSAARYADVLYRRYCEAAPATFAAIAAEYGVSRGRIQAIERHAIQCLRRSSAGWRWIVGLGAAAPVRFRQAVLAE